MTRRLRSTIWMPPRKSIPACSRSTLPTTPRRRAENLQRARLARRYPEVRAVFGEPRRMMADVPFMFRHPSRRASKSAHLRMTTPLSSPGYRSDMRVSLTTWNINSVRLRIDLVAKFLKSVRPDVLCLQETKCIDDAFPLKRFKRLGYEHVALNGQKGYHGVAVISKLPFE